MKNKLSEDSYNCHPAPGELLPIKKIGAFLKQEILNEEEVANMFSISVISLRRLRYKDMGPLYLKLGGKVVYRASDVNDFLENLATTKHTFKKNKEKEESS